MPFQIASPYQSNRHGLGEYYQVNRTQYLGLVVPIGRIIYQIIKKTTGVGENEFKLTCLLVRPIGKRNVFSTITCRGTRVARHGVGRGGNRRKRVVTKDWPTGPINQQFLYVTFRNRLPDCDVNDVLDNINTLKHFTETEKEEIMSNFVIRTFQDLLGVRAVTGTLRQNEHLLANGLSVKTIDKRFYINISPEEYTDWLISKLDELGLITEQYVGNSLCAINGMYKSEIGEFNEPKREACTFLITLDAKMGGEVLYSLVYDRDSESELAANVTELLHQKAVQKPIYLTAVTNIKNGNTVSDTRKLTESSVKMHPALYPFIDRDIDVLATDFDKSEENLLILLGPRGTGKTRLLRHLLLQIGSDREIYQLASEQLLQNPDFPDFISGLKDGAIVLMEDADNLIAKREDGNQSMSLILNELSGIASKNVKFILSTNLPSLDKADTALIRKGRLFDFLTFRNLTAEEISHIGEVVEGVEPKITGDGSLAEVFNGSNVMQKKVGFL